jgi:hypothetical protein
MNYLYHIKFFTDSTRYVSSFNNSSPKNFTPSEDGKEINSINLNEHIKLGDTPQYKLNQFLYNNIKKNKFIEKQQMKKSKVKLEDDKKDILKITNDKVDIFKDDIFTKINDIDENGNKIVKTNWSKLTYDTKKEKIESFLKLYVDYSFGEDKREKKKEDVDELINNEKNVNLLIKNVKYDKNNERVSIIKGFYPKKNKFIFDYQNEFHNKNLFLD